MGCVLVSSAFLPMVLFISDIKISHLAYTITKLLVCSPLSGGRLVQLL